MLNRNMGLAQRTFESIWVNRYGPPKRILANSKFRNETFWRALESFSVKFDPTPVRIHNKIGYLKQKHAVVRESCLCLEFDAKNMYSENTAQTWDESYNDSVAKIISRAKFPNKILFKSKLLSSFEMTKGYKPPFLGLSKTLLCENITKKHQGQHIKRKLKD